MKARETATRRMSGLNDLGHVYVATALVAKADVDGVVGVGHVHTAIDQAMAYPEYRR